jgi:hypothetical protein
MKERESVKGEYDGESLTVEGILLGRGLSFYGKILFWGFSWICREESLSSVVGKD